MNKHSAREVIKFLVLFTISFLFVLLVIFSINAFAYEYTQDDVELIGKLVEHECPHESELGQRLVIDTVMNRVESEEFPNTVRDVISQPGQYCNPKKSPPDNIYIIITQEAQNRTNPNVLWFRTKRYHTYGTPIIQEGSHYFSGEVDYADNE